MIAITTIIVISLLSQTSGFKSNSFINKGAQFKSKPQTLRNPTSIHLLQAPSLLLGARALISIPTLYSLMSINEYITHRYYQHTDFNKNQVLQTLAKFFLNTKNKAVKIRGGGHVGIIFIIYYDNIFIILLYIYQYLNIIIVIISLVIILFLFRTSRRNTR